MIQNRAAYIPGLPKRWGAVLSAMFASGSTRHAAKHETISAVQSDTERPALTATEQEIANAAERASQQIYLLCDKEKTTDAIISSIRILCKRAGVSFPAGQTDGEIIARAVDKVWWNRQMRKEHARRFEDTAITLGFTSLKAGPYISNESAVRQLRRNRQNDKLLQSITLQNEHGHSYTLDELADLGTANKSIRLGELMTRMRGFEEIAFDMGHIGMFWTITCPSKFHSVGGTNDNYNGSSPRQAQAYLAKLWTRIRTALRRASVQTYGIRIAEPHTDGCPHWHMMLFVNPALADVMEKVITKYALAEDGEEKGAIKNRVKLVRMEANMGTAAGYIIKYISKNVAGQGVGDHKDRDGNVIIPDVFENEYLTAAERVTLWSQTHGIRQFQQIGGAPIGAWRELRRIKAETVQNAPEAVKMAWRAVQKIESEDAAIAKQADFAEYVRVQGGPFVGRNGCIQIAKKMHLVEGRYVTKEVAKPCGVYHVQQQNAVYESVRYTWTVKDNKAVAVVLPWTGVNNCTNPGDSAPWTNPEIKILGPNDKKILAFDFAAEWKAARHSDEPDLVFDFSNFRRTSNG